MLCFIQSYLPSILALKVPPASVYSNLDYKWMVSFRGIFFASTVFFVAIPSSTPSQTFKGPFKIDDVTNAL